MDQLVVTKTPPSETEDSKDAAADAPEGGLRFEDPYWDDAFCAWWDPTLRTCC